MSQEGLQNIIYEKKDGTAIIYFNRPEKRNAMSFQMLKEFDVALGLAAKDGEVRVIIVAAQGPTFCVGGDVKEFIANTPQQTEEFNRFNLEVWRKMEKLRKPIIAAVHGYVNIEVIQAVDLVVAAEDARLGLPEVGIGVCPGAGITVRLPRAVGRYLAKELLFTGDWIPAQEAYRIGLVNRVVPREKLLEEALLLANKIGKKGPLAVGAAKACVNFGSEMPVDEGMEYQLRESISMFYTQDLKEGINSFLEKREPKFKGL